MSYQDWFNAVAFLAIGWLLGRTRTLDDRIEDLERGRVR